jgi:hypothetical protein
MPKPIIIKIIMEKLVIIKLIMAKPIKNSKYFWKNNHK